MGYLLYIASNPLIPAQAAETVSAQASTRSQVWPESPSYFRLWNLQGIPGRNSGHSTCATQDCGEVSTQRKAMRKKHFTGLSRRSCKIWVPVTLRSQPTWWCTTVTVLPSSLSLTSPRDHIHNKTPAHKPLSLARLSEGTRLRDRVLKTTCATGKPKKWQLQTPPHPTDSELPITFSVASM